MIKLCNILVYKLPGAMTTKSACSIAQTAFGNGFTDLGLRYTRSIVLLASGMFDSPETIVPSVIRSEEHTSELQSRFDLVCRLLLEKKKNTHKFVLHAISY